MAHEKDLILNASHEPAFDEISNYMNERERNLWEDYNKFIKDNYKCRPVIDYSNCSAKPGWNIKYKKSGKSLCTLYPEKDGFVVLVVVKLDLLPVLEELDPEIVKIANEAKPFNKTKWLMIPVKNKNMLQNVKELLMLKHSVK